jgi:ribosomal protein L7/L12
MTTTAPLPEAAQAALGRGKIVEAIKILRKTARCDLSTAKTRVDAALAADPALKQRVETQQRETRRKIMFWAIALDIVLIVALAYWWTSRD